MKVERKDPNERKYKIIMSVFFTGVIMVAVAGYLYVCRSCF